jgi:glycosyltransferase involved in cell wall biosynthesis
MQTAFAREMFREQPEKLFLPIQAAPLIMPRDIQVTVTIHDLAFKKFPETFPKVLLGKLNMLLAVALHRADKIIAVSEATRVDIHRYFPHIPAARVRVIPHGFAADFFLPAAAPAEMESVLSPHGLTPGDYVLYVGALQPRKNLVRLIGAFEQARTKAPEMRLVLVGKRAWLAEEILRAAETSPDRAAIHLPGQATFEELRAWYQGARLFAFPSLCEGFGMPLLEAMASGTPVLTARNSSLPEVAGDAAL